MTSDAARSDLALLTTATIWGFAFVAQRSGMDHLGPFTFNAIRFAMGCLVLLPIVIATWTRHLKHGSGTTLPDGADVGVAGDIYLAAGLAAGSVLFVGASFQQAGLVFTTAGKAGFITGLYVIGVPVLGVFLGKRTGWPTWAGALLAAAGLYLLTVRSSFDVAYGDLLVLAGAVAWAGHVHVIDHFAPHLDPIRLALSQFLVCATLSAIMALLIESPSTAGARAAVVPLLYAGFVSVGIAYTLQVVGQRGAPPAHAAIVMSLEAVFAVIGGWLLLGEHLTSREALGCAVMLGGMLVSQLSRRGPHVGRGSTTGVGGSNSPVGCQAWIFDAVEGAKILARAVNSTEAQVPLAGRIDAGRGGENEAVRVQPQRRW
jgi:drug/metabolite transporter (DMT)-like permease